MCKTMEGTVEELYQTVLEKMDDWGYSDQYTMLMELSRRMAEEADNCLSLEYMIIETEFSGISDE